MNKYMYSITIGLCEITKPRIINLSVIICMFIIPICLSAQIPNAGIKKLNPQLKELVAKKHITKEYNSILSYSADSIPRVGVIFKCTPEFADELVAQHGGELHSRAGDIFTALIPLSSIVDFASENEISRVEAGLRTSLTNDNAIGLIKADKVHTGGLPSAIPYTGKGVLVGVYDSGLDFIHKDFRAKNDSTRTRILSFWDQSVSAGTSPAVFNYGTEWQQSQIDASLYTPDDIPTYDEMGHGTHVAGSAAGLRGVAPDADLLIVKADLHWGSDDYVYEDLKRVLDGVTYIYNKAKELNRPCVVNISLGSLLGGPHDGSSLIEQGLDNLVNSGKGFFICVAAGNDNGRGKHFGGFPLTSDSIWTFAPDMQDSRLYSVFQSEFDDSTYISVTVDSAEFSEDWESMSPTTKIYQTPWISIASIKNAPSSIEFPVYFGNGDSAALITFTGSAYNKLHTELNIRTTRNPFRDTGEKGFLTATPFKIIFKGKGVMHAWWSDDVFANGTHPGNYGVSVDDRFMPSDDSYIMNLLACGNKVFAVGAFINRYSFKDTLNRTQFGMNFRQDNSGTMAFFSSLGPTTDGRVKPDFCAPGLNVASSLSRSTFAVPFWQTDANTIVYSGTSMASPIAAGAIALYLEQNPQATFEELKNDINNSLKKDFYTESDGPLPNKTWGHGKLDIFKAMGGVIQTDIKKSESGTNSILVYPNPTPHQITFETSSTTDIETLLIFDIKGKFIVREKIMNNINILDVSTWKKGTYLYNIIGKNNNYSGKFIVE